MPPEQLRPGAPMRRYGAWTETVVSILDLGRGVKIVNGPEGNELGLDIAGWPENTTLEDESSLQLCDIDRNPQMASQEQSILLAHPEKDYFSQNDYFIDESSDGRFPCQTSGSSQQTRTNNFETTSSFGAFDESGSQQHNRGSSEPKENDFVFVTTGKKDGDKNSTSVWRTDIVQGSKDRRIEGSRRQHYAADPWGRTSTKKGRESEPKLDTESLASPPPAEDDWMASVSKKDKKKKTGAAAAIEEPVEPPKPDPGLPKTEEADNIWDTWTTSKEEQLPALLALSEPACR